MNLPTPTAGSLLLCASVACGGQSACEGLGAAPQALSVTSASVLFIGNSLTGTQTSATGEDMPTVLSRMAASRSKSLTVVPLTTAFERVFASKPQSYLFNPDGNTRTTRRSISMR